MLSQRTSIGTWVHADLDTGMISSWYSVLDRNLCIMIYLDTGWLFCNKSVWTRQLWMNGWTSSSFFYPRLREGETECLGITISDLNVQHILDKLWGTRKVYDYYSTICQPKSHAIAEWCMGSYRWHCWKHRKDRTSPWLYYPLSLQR